VVPSRYSNIVVVEKGKLKPVVEGKAPNHISQYMDRVMTNWHY